MMQTRKPATHFVCVQIKNQQVCDQIRKLQEIIYFNSFENKHELRKAMTDTNLLHLLIAEVRCRSNEDLQKVVEALDRTQKKLLTMTEPQQYVKFNGLGVLGNTELYMHLLNNEAYKTLKLISVNIRNALADTGVELKPLRSFVAHLTVFKYTPDQIERGLRLTDNLWTPHMYSEFASEKLQTIQLCDALNRQRFCYYPVVWEKKIA